MAEKKKGKALAGAVCAAAVVVIMAAVLLVSRAYAKYAVETEGVSAAVTKFDVSSSVSYEDAWGTHTARDGDLGTMRAKEGDTIDFALTVANDGGVAVNCSLEVFGDFVFTVTTEDTGCYASGSTLTITDAVEPGGSVTALFTVMVGKYTRDDHDGVSYFSGTMYVALSYEQAEEA